ncbi:MBL fold metallo-hydrolase [Bacillus sp. UMB0899]|nr:MBL fold metallo-hydrolase [Bacillus sp. UMB0899]
MNIEKIKYDGYRIGIPVPFPMKYVYCYLFKQNDGYTMIDVGLNYSEAREAWAKVFEFLTIQFSDIKTIYLTHFHPDHTGLAGWMQELTGADVYMNDIDAEMMERVFGENSVQTVKLKEMILNHGVPEQLSEKIIMHMEKLRKSVLPLPKLKKIGLEVQFGHKIWKVIHTPGHSSGHVCFYQEDDKTMISGDMILDKITPNISVWPGASQKPLHDYMGSLRMLKTLSIKTAYTAHHVSIEQVNDRIDELIAHHHERLAKIENLARGKTAFEIAEVLFSHKNLTPHQWRFAIAETIAHLNYLEQENRIECQGTSPIIYHEKVNVSHQ